MDKIRLGIIGAGGIVCAMHIPEIVKENDFEIIVIGGRKGHRLKQQCEQYNIPGWTQNYDDIIADDNLDAILVATPHPLHVPWGMKAIEAGKHLLMEKPLCTDMGEADRFVEAAENSGVTVMCMPHMNAPVCKVRQLIAEETIGGISGAGVRTSHGGPEVYYAWIRKIFNEKDDDLWFFDAKRAGVGVLFDMGVYAVSELVAMLGTFKRVTGLMSTFDKPTELEDTATLILEMESGGIATAETSWCDPVGTWEASIHGTKGKFTILGRDGAILKQWMPPTYTGKSPAENIKIIDCSDADPGGIHKHFADCIRNGIQPPFSNIYAARHITEILVAGMESSKTGRAVELKTRSDG